MSPTHSEVFKRLLPRLSPAALQLYAAQEFITQLHSWVIDEWREDDEDEPRKYKGNVESDVTIDHVLDALEEAGLRFEWDGNNRHELEEAYFSFKCFNWPIDRLLHQQAEEFGHGIYMLTDGQIFTDDVKMLLGYSNLIVVEDVDCAVIVKAKRFCSIAEAYEDDDLHARPVRDEEKPEQAIDKDRN
jgi:hypothetical protein